MNEDVELDDESAEETDDVDPSRISEAVVYYSDWTTETIVDQLRKGNIELTPRFQRRDAWSRARKSRLIESLILGLPVPQIVLAEQLHQRGRYLVLDGKQRLLTLLQYWGLGEGAHNEFALSGLEVREDLHGKKYKQLEMDPAWSRDLAALQNQTIRTVVIRNWPGPSFLNLVFLRLNTGSVRLSPQELRQALKPGTFTDFVDDAASTSEALRKLLNLQGPDPRMRDVEILARAISFSFFLSSYAGRMKRFLDSSFEVLNEKWSTYETRIRAFIDGFEEAMMLLMDLLGHDQVARKPNSRSFNRAIFDALSLYFQSGEVRRWARAHPAQFKTFYNELFNNPTFRAAIESDTSGVPNTVDRLAEFGKGLAEISGIKLPTPRRTDSNSIEFSGLE
jgi:hypothetical protein